MKYEAKICNKEVAYDANFSYGIQNWRQLWTSIKTDDVIYLKIFKTYM